MPNTYRHVNPSVLPAPISLKRCTRRALLAGSAGCFLAAAAPRPSDLQVIEARYGGRLGIFALDTGSGRSLAYRADERFTLCSTMKLPLVACILAQVDAGDASLADIVHFGQPDLDALGDPDSFCPVTRPHLPNGALTLATLCEAAARQSDNLAANLLLKRAGGPASVTAFLRKLGDVVTRSDRAEIALNFYSGVLDTTTPRAIAGTLRELLLGNALHPESRALLQTWLMSAGTGAKRLRAAAPADWIEADKTGTGFGDEANDVALFWPPARAPLIVAAYYNALPNTPVEQREQVLRSAGTIVFAWAN